MKTNSFFASLIVVGALVGLTARADEIVRPTPVPTVSGAAQPNSVEEPAVIDHVVYLARLPSPDELMKGAELKATPIVRMDQTADRIVVVYQYGGGRTVTFAYTLLSSAGSSRAAANLPRSSAEYSVVTPSPTPAPTVVYAEPDVVYYSPRVRYYDPAWDFWAPFAVGVGFGWLGGHGHGGWHGGGHGGWHH